MPDADLCQSTALERFNPAPQDGGVERRPGRRAQGGGRIDKQRRQGGGCAATDPGLGILRSVLTKSAIC